MNKVNLKELKAKAKLGQIAFSEIDDTTMTLITALETAVEAHTSISKNSCCYACQQAKFVSLKALARIKELVEL